MQGLTPTVITTDEKGSIQSEFMSRLFEPLKILTL